MKKTLFSEIPHLKGDRIELRRLTPDDTPGLQELMNSPAVYRYLPTFLYEQKYEDVFEKKYPDAGTVISHLYD